VIPGIAHHITQRGNNRQPVFFCDDDRQHYLALLSRSAARFGTRILGYCLMTNHVHLVATPERADSLARTLASAHSEYAAKWNDNQKRTGHLWQGRFFSCPLDYSHLHAALRYVDQNPVRAGLAKYAGEWPWSSARAHAHEAIHDPALAGDWTARLDGWNFDQWNDILNAMATPQQSGWDSIRRATATGEPLGTPEFVSTLERAAGRRLQVLPRGRPPKPSGDGSNA